MHKKVENHWPVCLTYPRKTRREEHDCGLDSTSFPPAMLYQPLPAHTPLSLSLSLSFSLLFRVHMPSFFFLFSPFFFHLFRLHWGLFSFSRTRRNAPHQLPPHSSLFEPKSHRVTSPGIILPSSCRKNYSSDIQGEQSERYSKLLK